MGRGRIQYAARSLSPLAGSPLDPALFKVLRPGGRRRGSRVCPAGIHTTTTVTFTDDDHASIPPLNDDDDGTELVRQDGEWRIVFEE